MQNRNNVEQNKFYLCHYENKQFNHESAAMDRPVLGSCHVAQTRMEQSITMNTAGKALPANRMECDTNRVLCQKRAACLRERTRMRAMNGVFDILRSRVPYTGDSSKRISKIDTLRMTIRYIRQLRDILSHFDHNHSVECRNQYCPKFQHHNQLYDDDDDDNDYDDDGEDVDSDADGNGEKSQRTHNINQAKMR